VSVNGTLVENKKRRFKGECAHFSFLNFFNDTHDGASAKFSTNSPETDNSAAKIVMCSIVNNEHAHFLHISFLISVS
jgi:hypothetical protein